MCPSRISGAGLPLLLFCALVGGGVGVAGLAAGSDWPDAAGPTTASTTDVPDGGFDSTPSEDAQTTETETPEGEETTTPTSAETASPTPTAAEGTTPPSTPTDTPGSDDAGTGRSTTVDDDADAESRDPSEFEEAADGDGTDDPNDTDATDDSSEDADGESRDDAPGVEARSRSRMPTRGPELATIVLSFDDVPVSTISFSRRQYGNVTVEVLDGLPRGVEAPAGDRLSSLRITVPDELRDEPAKVMFTVTAATLDARDIPNDAVWLAHHDPDTGKWVPLETHLLHASDGRVVYAANTPGFSLFAIQGDGSRIRSPTPTEAADDSGTGAANATAAPEAEAAFVGGFGFSMGVVLFMGVVSVVTTVLGARRVSSVEVREEN